MLKLARLLGVLFLGSCAADPCTVTDGPDGSATLTCPDGSEAVISDGSSGTDNRIEASHFCLGLLEGTVLHFTYGAAVLTSGDVFAHASISGAAFEVGTSAYYSAQQNGAATARVIFTSDNLGAANAGWWDMALDRSTGIASIVYHDSDTAGGTMTWTMPASACTVNDY